MGKGETMNLHDRFQSFCRWCARVSEADSAAEAIRGTGEHERACPFQPKPDQVAALPGMAPAPYMGEKL